MIEVAMTGKKTAIYCRISTTQQRLDSQVDELNRWVDHNKPNRVKWFKDKYTGTSMKRPAMDALLEHMHNNKLSQIVCYRLDRLGRTASGLTKLFEDLQKHKCNLISLRDNLDLSTPSGRLNANIIASVASYETEIRAERVKAGQVSAKLRGKKWGGSKKGHRKGKVAEKVRSILALAQQKVSKAEISRTVGISVPTINSVLKEHQAFSG